MTRLRKVQVQVQDNNTMAQKVQVQGQVQDNNTMASSPNNNEKSKKRNAPQPGDPDYKTPTQLRNARKRRKVKVDKQSSSSDTQKEDPSLRYIAKPTAAPIVQKAINFFTEQDCDFDVTVGVTTGWRTVAKLAVRKQAGLLRIGLFVPGSHELLEVPQCQAHHPQINAAIDVLQTKCRKLSIQPFEENGTDNCKGSCLRHVAINIQRSTGKQQITLIWKEHDGGDDSKEATKLRALCDTLVQLSKNKNEPRLELHSLWVHYNNSWKHANSIFARDGRWEKLYGEDHLVEHLDIDDMENHLHIPLQFPPQVFRQANLDAFTNIIVKIRSWLKDQPARNKYNCLELYGGVGTIGLHLVDLLESLTSSDENPFNKDCFETTVTALQDQKPKCKCSISYESKNATDMVLTQNALNSVDLVIVDPPRKGLDEEVVQELCRTDGAGPSRLIYVSCGFDAFRRDFDNLTVTGQWKLDHAEGHVLFPGSDAIETLAFFTRANEA